MSAYEEALNHFKALLDAQLDRAERIKNAAPAKSYTASTPVTVGLVPGDGIGPIIMDETKRVMDALLKDELAAGTLTLKPIDGLTIERRLELGKSVPADVLEAVKACDVLLKGPTTTPKGGTMESANVTLRRELDLYANVRPVQIPEEGIDWIFYRENTEGEYVLGSQGISPCDDLSMDFKVTTDAGTRRIVRAAFEYARLNGKTSVAIVTKANIMKKTDGMFSRIAHEIAAEYPDIEAEDWYIDIMAANLVNPAIRSRFQVFVLPNLYGDIITDEAAQLQGGVGTAGSANIGGQYAMFEAIHGSAPRMVEQGIQDWANPESLLRALIMLLRHIARTAAADRLEKAVNAASARLKMTGEPGGNTARDFGDAVIAAL